MNVTDFMRKWRLSDLTERSGSHQHFCDLCELVGHPKPADVDPKGEWFTFEKGATKPDGSDGWADVWKEGFFAWEYTTRACSLSRWRVSITRTASWCCSGACDVRSV